MKTCIYCGTSVYKKIFCNIKCKNKFLVTDYRTHPINKDMRN